MPEPHDLRARLIAAVLIALGVAGLRHLPVAVAALVASVALAAVMGVGPRRALHRLAHVEGFVIVLLLFLPFTVPGQPLVRIGPLIASAEGLARAALIAVKVNTVALTILALLGNAAPERLGRALLALGLPERFVWLIELLARHIPTARDGLHRQSEAMRARAFRPRSNLHTWRSYGHLLGGALTRALDRAERVDEAMRLRGGGALAHAALPPMAAGAHRGVVLAAIAALTAICLDRLL